MITKKEIEIWKSKKHFFLEIKNKEYDIFRSFENLENLINHLKHYSIENKEEIIKELKGGLEK